LNRLHGLGLFGNLPGLLERIDNDLEKSPDYFKQNLGEVIIEKSFVDNLEVYPFPPFMLRGYVNPYDRKNNYPIHILNRSLLEKILFFAPRESESFLHEATHLFCSMPCGMRKEQEDFSRNGRG